MVYITPQKNIEVNRNPTLTPEQIKEENPLLLETLLTELGDNRLKGLEVLHGDTVLSVSVTRMGTWGVSVAAKPEDKPEEDNAVYEAKRTSSGMRINQLFPLTELSDTDENQQLFYDVFTSGISAIRLQKELEASQSRGSRFARLLGRNRGSRV